MITHFDDGNSKFGLQLNEFDDLGPKTKKKLIKLMARIMERAYRRGVQQTLHMKSKDAIDDWIIKNPHNYRYGKSLQTSIGLDGFVTTSITRLFMEENLENIGFSENET